MTDPLGEKTTLTYNAQGYLASVTNPAGKTQASFTYDSAERVATRTDSEGLIVRFAYDNADRLTTETFPDGTTRTLAYTTLDLTSATDRQGRTAHYAYDANRRLTSTTDPAGNVTRYTYFEDGTLQTLTDPNGHVTTWARDIQSRPTGKTFADTTAQTLAACRTYADPAYM